MDKTTAIINYLLTCPAVKNSPLYFNFVEAKDKSKQIITLANDKQTDKPYIDGSVMKRFTFTIQDFHAVKFDPVNPLLVSVDQNVESYVNAQGIIDWITEQDDTRNYPDFGENCEIESISALTDNPDTNGVQTAGGLNLAKYSVNIRVEYLDVSHRIWK